MMDAYVCFMVCNMVVLSPAILIVWFFGIRPFVAKHGRARVTAISWFFSMWADWSTAWEIGKETGTHSRSARIFLGIWLYWIAMFCGLVVLAVARQ